MAEIGGDALEHNRNPSRLVLSLTGESKPNHSLVVLLAISGLITLGGSGVCI